MWKKINTVSLINDCFFPVCVINEVVSVLTSDGDLHILNGFSLRRLQVLQKKEDEFLSQEIFPKTTKKKLEQHLERQGTEEVISYSWRESSE